MKIRLLLLILFTGYLLQAQEIEYGLKGGLNIVSITDDDYPFRGRLGFMLGMVMNTSINEKLDIQGELLYSDQGAAPIVDDPIRAEYVNIPISIHYQIYDVLYLHAGPQFGFKINDNLEFPLAELIGINTFDFSVIAGLGVHFESGIVIEARYNLGITNIIDPTFATITFPNQINLETEVQGEINQPFIETATTLDYNQLNLETGRNRVINFSIGYFFF